MTSATVLFLLGAVAFGGDFDPSYAGVFTDSADAATQSLFWPSFIGAALIVLSNPVSFGAFLGDWSRYIPASTPRRRVVGAAFLSQIATLLPFVFGLATASIIAAKAPEYVDPAAPDFVGGLLAISPGWFFLPVCLLALIGGMSTGTTALYGTGLDFSSVFPRLSRVQATLLVGVLSIAFIFVGRFGLDLVQSISTFATMIVTCTTPWMVVMMLGFFTRRGWYDPDALQVFNRRQRGGRYWFAHGWNWRGHDRLVGLRGVGVLFTNIPGQFVGPLGELANGIDISLPLSLAVAAVLFLTLLRSSPSRGPLRARGRPARPHRRRAGAADHRSGCGVGALGYVAGMTNFVLVAGARLGAWAWDEVRAELRAAGHGAHPLTLSGLAEKRGVPAGQQTHVRDIVDEVERLDLRDVVLVGHSYSGIPVGQAAERIGDRLARVVFVDSSVPSTASRSCRAGRATTSCKADRRERRLLAAGGRGRLRRPGPDGRADRPDRRRLVPAPGRHAHRARRADAPPGRASGDLHQVPPRRRRADARRGRAADERALGAGRDGHRPLADVLPAARTGPDSRRVRRDPALPS